MVSLRAFVEDPYSSYASAAFHVLILLLIVASCTSVILQTMPEYHEQPMFFALEALVTVVFTGELLVRLFAASPDVFAIFSALNFLDFAALSPGYAMLLGAALPKQPQQLLQMAWFLRMPRCLKIAQQLHPALERQLSGSMLLHVFNSSALAILAVLSFLVVVSASLLYLVESDRCEERGLPCAGFESIPASFWFSTITLTTVGYGDVYPFTALGRAVAAFLATCAVILLSLSAALLSVNLAETKRTQQVALDQTEKEMLLDLKKSWDTLAHSLAVANAQAAKECTVAGRPTLQLLEDKGRSLCFEMQECLSLMLQPH
eukprot:s25_g11.t1